MVQKVKDTREPVREKPDGDFWEKAHDKYFCPLCGRACRSLTNGDWAAAQDLVSEGFLRVMSCYPTNPEEIENLPGYLWVVIERLSFEKRRKEKPDKTDSLEEVVNTKQHPAVGPSAERNMEIKELIQVLQAALGSISPRKAMLLTYYLKGYKPGEIAAELDEDVRNTYADISALKATLRRALTKTKAKTTRQGKP